MKLMAYNILMGGDRQAGDRTHLLLDVIRRADPDVLGLCECKGFEADGEARLQFFCRELRMDAVMNRAVEGNHVTLFYRRGLRPAVTSTTNELMQHGAVRLVLPTVELGPITFVLTHLHAYSSWFRVTEAQTVVAKALSKIPEALIFGDMNAVAAVDLPLDPAAAPRGMVTRLSAPQGGIDTQTIDTFLRHGFQDLGAGAVGPTYSTAVGDEGDAGGPLVRLDYIFATPGLAARCRAIGAVRESPADRASDHLPVVADFDLTLQE
jgi:endonuclease/exonuclease/phosphatase family metal-dependent hydrolase